MIRYNTLEEQYKADLSGDMVYIENGYKVINSILNNDDTTMLENVILSTFSEEDLAALFKYMEPFTESDKTLLEAILDDDEIRTADTKEKINKLFDKIEDAPQAYGTILKIIQISSALLAIATGTTAGLGSYVGISTSLLKALGSTLTSIGISVGVGMTAGFFISMGVSYLTVRFVEWLLTKCIGFFCGEKWTTVSAKQRELARIRSILRENMNVAKKHNNEKAYQTFKSLDERVKNKIIKKSRDINYGID